MVKNSDEASTSWITMDNKRDGYNAFNRLLFPNETSSENATNYVDILSNGFKLRSASGWPNSDTKIHIFAAFAETPLKYSNAR